MKRNTILPVIVDWGLSIIIAFVLAILIKIFIFGLIVVNGDSMYPTLINKEKLISNNTSVIHKNYERGDIVVLDSPHSKRVKYIKRVIGVEGDKVEIKGGKVYLNNEEVEENYTSQPYTDTYDNDSWIVPEGRVFVLGDNREMFASEDSRVFGCVPIKKLRGKASIRIRPLSKFGEIDVEN